MDGVNDPTFDSFLCFKFSLHFIKGFIRKLNFKTNEIMNVGPPTSTLLMHQNFGFN